MNNNVIKSIYNWNKEAGLLEMGYSDERESAFPIEEALEGFKYLPDLAEVIGSHSDRPKDMSRYIVGIAQHGTGDIIEAEIISNVDRLDKHIDSIIYNFGSIFKIGLSPQQAMRAIDIVMRANQQKLLAGKDEAGKQKKPDGFIPPEASLQKLLTEAGLWKKIYNKNV